MSRIKIRASVVDIFRTSLRNRYLNLDVDESINFLYADFDDCLRLKISNSKLNESELLQVSSKFLSNSIVIERCRESMSDKDRSEFYDFVDFVLDHDSFRNDSQIHILKYLKRHHLELYEKSVNDLIEDYLNSKESQILIETYTTKLCDELKKRGYI